MKARGTERTEANAVMKIAKHTNPPRAAFLLSTPANTVPIASAPNIAPSPHVA